MDITVFPRKLNGTISAIPSKSQAHRYLICAAFADKPTTIICNQTNQDIEATVACLNALGAQITRTATGYIVIPVMSLPQKATLQCRESGSTLRFMLPVVGALGVNATFIMEGRLPLRPLSPLWEEMERMGCLLSRPTSNTIVCSGKLRAGHYQINGNVSSQFISGLHLAMTIIDGASSLSMCGKLESKPYVDMTCLALQQFGIRIDNYSIPTNQQFVSPGCIAVEGDWSNSAFFLTAACVGSDISLTGLNHASVQGDRAVIEILQRLSTNITIDAANIPDLVPILAVTAATICGATFTNIARLRLKESDRVATVAEMLNNLGARTKISDNELRVYPGQFHGCIINAHGDHRIAMSAAIAATVSSGPVTILGAECVAKSYPSFWEDYNKLGGHYEQYIR